MNIKSASKIIQIDPIVAKTPKVHGNNNQETRKDAVQLNIVEVDENVTSECCAQNQTKYPKLFQILTCIGQILKWIVDLISLLVDLITLLLVSIVAMGFFLLFSSGFCFGIWVLTWKTIYIQGICVTLLVYIGDTIMLALCVSGFYNCLLWFKGLKGYAKNVLKTFLDFLDFFGQHRYSSAPINSVVLNKREGGIFFSPYIGENNACFGENFKSY